MIDLAPLTQSTLATLLTVLYTAGFVVVGLFSLRAALHIGLWFRTRRVRPAAARSHAAWLRPDAPPTLAEGVSAGDPALGGPVPFVTVQLPVYNERHVAARLVDAACGLRWPRDRFEVQVVDDSTDETRAIIDDAARRWQGRGVAVHVVRRADRRGYKGGALAEALPLARGEALAVFDADFRPPPDWLAHVMAHLGDGVAAVQTRWGHLNRDQRVLTRVQALSLDGYFAIEQAARSRAGLALHFNGSAGVWRRDAIEAAGGWSGDTLCEDVDLSYRAQLAGWRIVMLPEHAAPAELPATVLAFKRQQHRWAKGTVQCWRGLVGRLWRAPWPRAKRLHAIASLSTYFVQPTLVVLFLGAPLLAVTQPRFHPLLFAFSALALTMPVLVGLGQLSLHRMAVAGGAPAGEPGWWRRLLWYPCLSIVAAGMTLNGALAVVEALSGAPGAFERTPKAGEAAGDADGSAASDPRPTTYRLPLDGQSLAEALLAAYAWFGLALAVDHRAWGVVAFMAPFAAGFSYVAGWSLAEGLPALRRQRRRRWGRAVS